MPVTLRHLKVGRKAKIVEIAGGHLMQLRLSALGIMPGKAIRKMSSLSRFGPVTIRVGHSTMALGRGMSEKIMVEEEI